MTLSMCEPVPGPPCTSAARRALDRSSASLEEVRRALKRDPDDSTLRDLVQRAVLHERERRLIWESTPGGQRHLLQGLEAARRPESTALDEIRDRVAAGRARRVAQRLRLLQVEGEGARAQAESVALMLSRMGHDRRIVASWGCPSQRVGFFLECHPETSVWTDAGAGPGDLADFVEAGAPSEGPYVAILRREQGRAQLAWWRRADTMSDARTAAELFQVRSIWDPQASEDLRTALVPGRAASATRSRELDAAAEMVQRCAAAPRATATAAADLAHWRRRLAERYSA